MNMHDLAKEAVQASYRALYGVDRPSERHDPERQANAVKLACTLIAWSDGKPDIDVVRIEKQENNR